MGEKTLDGAFRDRGQGAFERPHQKAWFRVGLLGARAFSYLLVPLVTRTYGGGVSPQVVRAARTLMLMVAADPRSLPGPESP